MKSQHDSVLLSITVVLLLFGTVMIYSTSAVFAERQFQDSHHFLITHLAHLVLGVGAMAFAAKIDYHRWRDWLPPIMVVMLVMLVMVLIPGIGHEVKGARRWIRIPGMGIQPSEILKIVMIIYVASHLDRKQDVMSSFFRGVSPNYAVAGVYLSLVLLQPDFGTAALISMSILLMIYIGGARKVHIFGSIVAFGGLATVLVLSQTYRVRRLMAFMDPWGDPLDSGFQIIQSFIALGSGGLLGRGLGDGRQKLFFLPDAHTDFIFAIVGEELGFIGVVILVAMFVALLWRGFKISMNAPDTFGRYLAFGFTSIIGTQTVLNLFVVTGLLPTKGLPLPFVSAGGTSLVVVLFMTGVLLNISKGHVGEESNNIPRTLRSATR